MDRALARNLLILLAITAVVTFAPGAGVTTEVANTLVNGAILTVLVVAAGVFYRRHQRDLWSLGDVHRAALYAALGGFVVLMAARDRLADSGAGTLVLVIGLAVVAAAVFAVVQRLRAYR